MNFPTFQYMFVFLPAALGLYFWLGRTRSAFWSKSGLLLASLIFYSLGAVNDVPLLLASAIGNFLIARRLLTHEDGRFVSRWTVLIAGILANVVFLCYFKYAGFLVDTTNRVLGTGAAVPLRAFPLGISFFTIQQIMFLVDCYEGLVEEHHWLDHLVFASWFPYIVAGPIVRWKQVAPQWNEPEARIRRRPLQEGCDCRQLSALGRRRLQLRASPIVRRRLDHGAGVHAPAVLRLQRLH
jgi:D-alanyl-lipoteichoic acid acyltransferase DltB (MBOAT superfamily)